MNINYSFIIPHKNCPDLLQRCVNSIPERDDVQVIVVDDNSDEGKKPSLKDHKNLQVILLDAEHSKGAGRARNEGLKQVEGKWLVFPDSDDYYNNGFLDVLDRYKDTVYDIIYFNFEHRDGKTGVELPPIKSQGYYNNYDESREAIDLIKFRHNAPWAKMVRREYVKEHNIWFEEVPNGNDILFSMMVGYFTDNIIVEKEKLYVYLRNINSILTSKETVDGALCRITHAIKRNYLYGYIGHPKWKQPVLLRIMKNIVELRLPFLITIIKNAHRLFTERKEWVKLIESCE